MHIYGSECAHICTLTHIDVDRHAKRIHTHTHTHKHTNAHVRKHLCRFIHTHTHTHTHSHNQIFRMHEKCYIGMAGLVTDMQTLEVMHITHLRSVNLVTTDLSCKSTTYMIQDHANFFTLLILLNVLILILKLG
jgi:hypothetical protein